MQVSVASVEDVERRECRQHRLRRKQAAVPQRGRALG
jgi:hypothetical protein